MENNVENIQADIRVWRINKTQVVVHKWCQFFQCLLICLMYRRWTEVLLAVVPFSLAASTALTLSAPIVISIKFLLIISVHYNTWRSWELGPPYNAVRGNFSPVVLKRNLLQAWSIEQISFDPGSGLSELNNERKHFVWMWEENLSV